MVGIGFVGLVGGIHLGEVLGIGLQLQELADGEFRLELVEQGFD